MIVAVVIGGVIVMVWVALALTLRKADRTPEQARYDWWPDFERDFRAYARRSARQPREPRQEHPERRPHRPENR